MDGEDNKDLKRVEAPKRGLIGIARSNKCQELNEATVLLLEIS